MPKGKKMAGPVYQLKITLAGIRPPIWRRVQVRDCSLTKLHEVIQIVMGWRFSHLWGFDVEGEQYGESPWGTDMRSSTRIKLSRQVEEGIKTFGYTYDFGDNWEHIVTVEKTLDPDPAAKYPRCTAGKRACPPEDCGGPWMYADFLKAINNPTHEDHEDLLEWVGGEFDSEEFDLNEVNTELASLR